MSVVIDLPADVLARLEAEAGRRSITVEELIVDLAAALPATDAARPNHRLSFIGIGASGNTEPTDARRIRADLAVQKTVEGI